MEKRNITYRVIVHLDCVKAFGEKYKEYIVMVENLDNNRLFTLFSPKGIYDDVCRFGNGVEVDKDIRIGDWVCADGDDDVWEVDNISSLNGKNVYECFNVKDKFRVIETFYEEELLKLC